MSYSYQDIHFIPKYSEFHSRSDIDLSVDFGPREFKIPVVPANMACSIDQKLAKWMSQNDYFYIMHRFGLSKDSITAEQRAEDNFEFVKTANEEKWKTISISIGVQDLDKQFLVRCIENNLAIDYITIDIAHAHSIRMKEMMEFVKGLEFKTYLSTKWDDRFDGRGRLVFPMIYNPFVIAGNVASPEAVSDLEEWGADAIKVGIAQGGACTTFGQTGFGVPMWTCMQDCIDVAEVPLIADGGVRTNGDFFKALVAGGTMVMAGSMFASSIDSPAETVVKYFATNEVEPKLDVHGGVVVGEYQNKVVKKVFKRYYGSASSINKGSDSHVEGTMVELECDGTTYQQKLKYIEGHLQSSISYNGGYDCDVEFGVIGSE